MNSISDVLWNKIKWIFCKNKGRGRPPRNPRQVLNGILFIIDSGAQWRRLPSEYGPKNTVHGQFVRWAKSGVFQKLFEYLRELYFCSNEDFGWFAIDAIHVKAPIALFSGKSPVDREKRGVKRTIIVEWNGAPVALNIGAGNVHDSKFFKDAFTQLQSKKYPQIIAADSAYDCKYFSQLCARANFALIASTNPRRSKNIHKIYPSNRWKVERTHGWFSWKRGLKTCWCKLQKTYSAFVAFYASIILFKKL